MFRKADENSSWKSERCGSAWPTIPRKGDIYAGRENTQKGAVDPRSRCLCRQGILHKKIEPILYIFHSPSDLETFLEEAALVCIMMKMCPISSILLSSFRKEGCTQKEYKANIQVYWQVSPGGREGWKVKMNCVGREGTALCGVLWNKKKEEKKKNQNSLFPFLMLDAGRTKGESSLWAGRCGRSVWMKLLPLKLAGKLYNEVKKTLQRAGAGRAGPEITFGWTRGERNGIFHLWGIHSHHLLLLPCSWYFLPLPPLPLTPAPAHCHFCLTQIILPA